PTDPQLAHGDADSDSPVHADLHAHDHPSEGGESGDDHHVPVRHRFAGITSFVGPAVLIASFGLVLAIFFAMRTAGGGEIHAPFIQHYFTWMVAGDLNIAAAFQLDQLSMIMMLVIT